MSKKLPRFPFEIGTSNHIKMIREVRHGFLRRLSLLLLLNLFLVGMIGCSSNNHTEALLETNNTTNLQNSLEESTTTIPVISKDVTSYLVKYLDPNYTVMWNSVNMPDLGKLNWTDDTQDGNGWETGILTVYLENIGSAGIKVNVTATESSNLAKLGFSVTSDTVTLIPNQRSPIDIKINENPSYIQKNPDNTVTIYFHVQLSD